MALERGIEILMEGNLHNAIIEANSKLVINVAKKMCNRKAHGKVSKHWRLSQVFQHILSQLQTLRTVSFIHVRRKCNMLANHLANEGVLCKESYIGYDWEFVPSRKLHDDC